MGVAPYFTPHFRNEYLAICVIPKYIKLIYCLLNHTIDASSKGEGEIWQTFEVKIDDFGRAIKLLQR